MADPGFFQPLFLSFEAIGRLFFVVLIGVLFVKTGLLSDRGLNDLTRIIIDAVVPCALSVAMIKGFDMDTMNLIWPLIMVPPLMITGTVLLTQLYFRIWRGSDPSTDNAVSAMAAIPNSFYVPFPLALAVTPPESHVTVGILLGAAVLAINPLQWTLGTWLVMGKKAEGSGWKSSLRHILNGPVLGVTGGVFLAFIPGFAEAARGEPGSFLPLRMILKGMELVGEAMAPLAMFIIGALMARCQLRRAISFRLLFPIVLFRFILIPGICLWLIIEDVLPISGLVAFVLLLEASSPPAMNLAVVARRYGGDWDIISGIQLVVNALALIALPIWMSIGLRM